MLAIDVTAAVLNNGTVTRLRQLSNMLDIKVTEAVFKSGT